VAAGGDDHERAAVLLERFLEPSKRLRAPVRAVAVPVIIASSSEQDDTILSGSPST
jgi:hypothetical protein